MVADGNFNTKLIAEFRSYPNSNPGTIDSGQSLELNIDAYKDFGTARGVIELVARIDDQDSGRRILDARQAYIGGEIGGFEIYVGNRQEFRTKRVITTNYINIFFNIGTLYTNGFYGGLFSLQIRDSTPLFKRLLSFKPLYCFNFFDGYPQK